MSSPTSFGAFSYVNEGRGRELLNLNTNLEDLELSGMCLGLESAYFTKKYKIYKIIDDYLKETDILYTNFLLLEFDLLFQFPMWLKSVVLNAPAKLGVIFYVFCILYTHSVFCILCFVFCFLFVFCVLYFSFCIFLLYFAYLISCILYFAFCMFLLYFAFCI